MPAGAGAVARSIPVVVVNLEDHAAPSADGLLGTHRTLELAPLPRDVQAASRINRRPAEGRDLISPDSGAFQARLGMPEGFGRAIGTRPADEIGELVRLKSRRRALDHHAETIAAAGSADPGPTLGLLDFATPLAGHADDFETPHASETGLLPSLFLFPQRLPRLCGSAFSVFSLGHCNLAAFRIIWTLENSHEQRGERSLRRRVAPAHVPHLRGQIRSPQVRA